MIHMYISQFCILFLLLCDLLFISLKSQNPKRKRLRTQEKKGMWNEM